MDINKCKTLNLIDRRFILEDCHQKQKQKKFQILCGVTS